MITKPWNGKTKLNILHEMIFINHIIYVLFKVAHGVHFSKPAQDGVDQFENIPHEMNEQVNG